MGVACFLTLQADTQNVRKRRFKQQTLKEWK